MAEHNYPAWTVIIPLKSPETGKSRLAVSEVDRFRLAQAIAQDTLEAVSAAARVAEVVVVSTTTSWQLPVGARLVQEAQATTIDDAVALAASTTAEHSYRAVMLGDLPGLNPAELDMVLDQAAHLYRGFVPDVEGTGTTLVTTRPGVALDTAFGPDSARQHRGLGFVDLPAPASSTLRRDVDILDHLLSSVGPRTSALNHLFYASNSSYISSL